MRIFDGTTNFENMLLFSPKYAQCALDNNFCGWQKIARARRTNYRHAVECTTHQHMLCELSSPSFLWSAFCPPKLEGPRRIACDAPVYGVWVGAGKMGSVDTTQKFGCITISHTHKIKQIKLTCNVYLGEGQYSGSKFGFPMASSNLVWVSWVKSMCYKPWPVTRDCA